jgi:parvulin-like peptidyl-prolyl isomerase
MKEYYISNVLAKEYTVIAFPFEYYLKKAKNIPVTQEELKEYFEKHYKNYLTPEKRAVQLWKFTPSTYGIVVNQQDIEQYYTAHKSQFMESPLHVQVRRIVFYVHENDKKSLEEAEKKALQVKQELEKNPALFEELAQKYSEDKTSAIKGGLVEFFKKGDRDPEFEKAALRLRNDGDISGVILTHDGFEILQRVARKPAVYKPLTMVESIIKQKVYEQKFKAQFTEDAAKLLQKYPQEQRTHSIEEFAKSKGAHAVTKELANDGTPLAEKLFKVQTGQWTSFVDQSEGILATVVSVEKSHKSELTAVTKSVEQDLYKERARTLLDNDLAQAQMLDSATIKANYPHSSVKNTGMIKKEDKEKLKEFEDQGISSDVFDQLEQQGAVSIVHAPASGFLIRVNKIEEFDQKRFEENKAVIAQELYAQNKELLQKSFIASLYRNATINLTQSLLTLKEEN